MHGIFYCPSCTPQVVVEMEAFSVANTETIDFGSEPEADLNWLAWAFDIDRSDIEACKQAGFPTPVYHLSITTFCGDCLWWFK